MPIQFVQSQPIMTTVFRKNDVLLPNWICCSSQLNVKTANQQVMPDDYSKLVPHLPIPNRTVKRLCADDSAATSVKVGHRQAFIRKPPSLTARGFLLCATDSWRAVNSNHLPHITTSKSSYLHRC